MKILVLNPSSKFTKNVVRDVLYGCWCKGKRIGGASVPPFALLSVATVLKKNGLDVTFLDAVAEQIPFNELVNIGIKYDIIIISSATMSYVEDTFLLEKIKRKKNEIISIVFGAHPTFQPEAALETEMVDFIILGEPEKNIKELIVYLKEGRDYSDLPGIGYRKGQNKKINEIEYIKDLDELPFLDVDMLPKNIHYFNPLIKRMPYITTTASRGCPGRCTFCTAPFFYGPKIRFKTDEKLLNEMEYYSSKGYREIYFRDETFIIKNKRDKMFCEKLIKRNLDLTWICNVRIGMVDYEDIVYMKKAGCHLIKTGVESGSQEILDNVKKGITIKQTKQFFKWTHEIGIDTHAHVMLGMPGETKETIEKTIDFVMEIAPTTATFGICTPYPGSPLFNEVLKKISRNKRWK